MLDGLPRRTRLFSPLIHALILVSLGIPSLSLAAWAVYADSWTSPTQAQEQAIRINRSLSIESATYERATVQGRVFWRVRVGVYRTRSEAQEVRQRLSGAGISDSWMREVGDEELPAQAPPAFAVPRPDTTRVDSAAQAIIDSLAMFTRRQLDSLETVTQQRLEEIIRQMRGQLSQEVIEQLEQSRARDRAIYVTQAEQAQMTRALLDEMSSHLDAIRDSLRREKAEQNALAALLPQLSGSVAARTLVNYEKRDEGSTHMAERVLLSEARSTLGWTSDRSDVLIDLRAYSTSEVDVSQAYATWTFARSRSASYRVGVGIVEAPYGLEPASWAELVAPSPSQLTQFRPGSQFSLWLVPYESRRVRLLLFPYGNWDENNQYGLAQMRLTWPGAIVELTGGGDRSRDSARRNSETVYGDLTARWQGERWFFGAEGLFQRRREPAYGEEWVDLGLRREVDTWGVLALIHCRFSPHWGWTVRGDVLAHTTRWTDLGEIVCVAITEPCPAKEPVERRGTLTTGPMVYAGSRLRVFLMYTLDLHETRPTGGTSKRLDQEHRVEFGMSHVF